MAGRVPNSGPAPDSQVVGTGAPLPDRVEITIPDPSLVVLIGAAGAGKSTFAQRWFAPDEILSSDALRALVSGDAADQSASRAAFALLHRELDGRLRSGRLTVIDATNVHRTARRSLLLRSAGTGHPAVAIVLDLPAKTVHQRNAARADRVVEVAVVDRQLADLRRTLARSQLAAEGFAAIHTLSSPAHLDAVHLVRVRPGVLAQDPGWASPRRSPG